MNVTETGWLVVLLYDVRKSQYGADNGVLNDRRCVRYCRRQHALKTDDSSL
jgi:hypothetical protein